MINFKAKMFNRKASNPKNKPDQIITTLSPLHGQKIADIGAGGGYFTLRFADAVGKRGQVYAVDVNNEFLEFIQKNAKENKIDNIKTISATLDNPNLPEKTLDIIFIRNVYHHLPNRTKYFRNLINTLKPPGKLAVIDYKGTGPLSFHKLFKHYTPKETIIDEIEKAGYKLIQEYDILPKQHFLIFDLKKGTLIG